MSPAFAAPGRKPKKGKEPKPTAPVSDVDDGDDIDDVRERMERYVSKFTTEIARVRGGEPNPNMLDHVTVDAYGAESPLTDVAQVVIRNPKLLTVSPFDPSLAAAVGDAIRDSGMNLNPVVEDGSVKVPLPKTSKETRDASVKLIMRLAEETKQRVRAVRQKAVDKLKKAEGISADETFRMIKEVQEVTNGVTSTISSTAQARKDQIMSL